MNAIERWAAAVLGVLAAASARAQAVPASRPTPPPTLAFPGQWAPHPSEWKFPVFPRGCARFEGPERTECLDFVASDFGRLARYAAANAALGAPKAGETRVVFFGDSITDGWSRAENGGFFPGKPYVNRGIGGQTTPRCCCASATTSSTSSRRWW